MESRSLRWRRQGQWSALQDSDALYAAESTLVVTQEIHRRAVGQNIAFHPSVVFVACMRMNGCTKEDYFLCVNIMVNVCTKEGLYLLCKSYVFSYISCEQLSANESLPRVVDCYWAVGVVV